MKRLFTSLFLLALVGCGGPPKLQYDFPQLPNADTYESVWVEPRIVLSDSLFTVIRAERLDSILIDPEAEKFSPVTKSIAFFIDQPQCFTVVNILDNKGNVIAPLMAEYLGPGYYRLSLNEALLNRQSWPAGFYDLRAETCADTKSSRFNL